MTVTSNIHISKNYLSRFWEQVVHFKDAFLTKIGMKESIVVIDKNLEPRKPGSAKGKIWMAPDFNAPLPDEWLDAFDGGQLENKIT